MADKLFAFDHLLKLLKSGICIKCTVLKAMCGFCLFIFLCQFSSIVSIGALLNQTVDNVTSLFEYMNPLLIINRKTYL